MQYVNNGTRELDWLAMHRIAIGIAHGMEYLHTSITPQIAHRDLKPANILLDHNMEPSYGVLLEFLVIGKLPSDEFFQETSEMSMVRWMTMLVTSGNPENAINPKLTGKGYDAQMILLLKMACLCTRKNPQDRPTSKDCRIMLSKKPMGIRLRRQLSFNCRLKTPLKY
ncbi:hypothetical protein LXL04_033341 [Taraxacum kok-saghyz]